jgi:hypothetical protein
MTNLPVGALRSRPSWTLTKVPPACSIRLIARSPSTTAASEAVDFGDDHAVGLAVFDPVQRQQQIGPVAAPAALVQLFEYLAEVNLIAAPDPALDLLQLHRRRDEALALAIADLRNPDVAVEHHFKPPLFDPRLPHSSYY